VSGDRRRWRLDCRMAVSTGGSSGARSRNGRQYGFLEALDFSNLEARIHNIVDDPLEQGTFDLVHARHVLAHLSQCDDVLKRIAAAFKPGAWLLVEESDYSSSYADPRSGEAACDLLVRALGAAPEAIGMDLYYGRRLYADLRALELVDVGAEGRVVVGHGGATQDSQFWRLTFTHIRDRIIATGGECGRCRSPDRRLRGSHFRLDGPVVVSRGDAASR